MHRLFVSFALALTALFVACGDPANAERKPFGFGDAGSAGSPPVATGTSAAGGAELSPLTEEELRRLLDRLEREIGER